MSVDISDVAYIKWNDEKSLIVVEAMKKTGNKKNGMVARDLAKALQDKGISCSYQNLYKLLTGKYSVVSLEIAQGICEVLSIPVPEIIKIHTFLLTGVD
ncbi:hypothetical protein A6769_35335 [Nostoc punctiforme NIES-2108]|uniref:HTH cro/C1-type domain-containing protein n=1 Tax=Nostoc punctiforme NIES-2108 TaxID=1356359 RepID=A0A367QZ99_NOSPU|nr:hypothetical protein A6769_35335 [Nostoc punctiforme NIES-2108]